MFLDKTVYVFTQLRDVTKGQFLSGVHLVETQFSFCRVDTEHSRVGEG